MQHANPAQRLILSESRVLRLFTFFFFYFAQGLPSGLTTVALTAWVAANGGSSTDVASIIAVAYLPWSWKFIIAFVMDRYSYLPMGRRRAWLILAQLLMSAGFIAAAVLAPGPKDIDVLLIVTFLVMAGGATQDVAVDGMAVDLLPEKEQGTASSFMFGGQAVGIALSGAAGAAGLQYLGSATTFLLFIPVLLLPTIYAVILRERPGEKLFPWSQGATSRQNLELVVEDWLAIFKITLKSLFRGASLVFVAGQCSMRTAAGILAPMWPLLATGLIGWDETQYASTSSTVDLVMAILAIGIGSYVTVRFGGRRSTIVVAVAAAGLALFIGLSGTIWASPGPFVALLVVASLITVLSSICTNPLRMQLSDKRVSATQFTIYNSISNLPISIGATLFATLGGVDNLTQTVLVSAALSTVAAVLFAVLRMPAETGLHAGQEEFGEGLVPRPE